MRGACSGSIDVDTQLSRSALECCVVLQVGQREQLLGLGHAVMADKDVKVITSY